MDRLRDGDDAADLRSELFRARRAVGTLAAPSVRTDPRGRVVARLLPAPHLAIDSCSSEAFCS